MKRLPPADLQQILHKTKGIWEPVRNTKIFLTGGTGFFGKWLLESFVFINEQLQLNAAITVLTRNPEKFLAEFPFYRSNLKVTFIKGDVITFDFPAVEYDYIIHAATDADAALNTAYPLLMLDTITAGTRRMLDFAKLNPVKSFLLTSSGAVYGKQPASVTHIKETESYAVDINNSHSAYAEGKRLAELYCSIYHSHYKLPVKIARCFAFVGPYLPLNKHFAVGNFILNAINREDIIIKGDGTSWRSYLYAADLAVWLWKILLQGEDNIPYNVGSDEDYDLKAVAEKVASSTPGIVVKVLSEKDPLKSVERYVPDITLAKKKLGVEVSFNLAESITRTKNFYTDDEIV